MVLSPGQEIAARYEIIDKIGSGGMAYVYKAMDKKLRRFVTFKVMREEYVMDEEFLKRFDVEARAAASLLNQHIVNVYDVGQEDDIHYIVMEYVDGVTLKQLIKKRAPFENDEILGVAIQIATALEHAHKNDIIHRDIKPQNILVTKGGISKVTDFGIARASATSTMTTTNNTMGSVHYFSPEQARGGFVDIKSDIYSLGVVMYEMATGKLPFDGDTAISIALKHINDPLPDLKELNPKLSDRVIAIIRKATSKLSADRYQSITEMGNDLKRALTNSIEDARGFGESPTLNITEEDIAEINREAAMSQPATKVPRPRRRIERVPVEELEEESVLSDRKVVIAAVATSLVLIILISALVYSIFWKPATENPSAAISVPDLYGYSLEEATVITDALGIEIQVQDEQVSDDVEAGGIISQNTGEVEELTEGGILWVVLSSGSDKYLVPDVTMLGISEAYDKFEELNYPLETREELEWNDNVPQNTVIRQEPQGGDLVPANTVITLYISNGPKQKTAMVPTIAGRTEAEAINELQDVGLAAAPATRAPSDTVPEGTVIRQLTSPHTEVPIGTPVEFVVSSGPETAMPVPTPTATPAGTGTTPAESTPAETRTTVPLSINLPSIPEGAESVHVLVVLSKSGEDAVQIFNDTVDVSSLPLKLSVSGTGHAEVLVFTVDESGNQRHQASETIDFTKDNGE